MSHIYHQQSPAFISSLAESGEINNARVSAGAGTGKLAKQADGAYDTARMFRSWRPDMRLLGETSGKNAMIVTPSADPDLAIRDVVSSAFAHAGQKCSAASLLILVGSAGRSPRIAH